MRAEDDELVAAQTRHDVVGPHDVSESLRELPRHLVARGVAEAVVEPA